MKLTIKKSKDKAAFTIVELLTVMSIVVILFSLLVPSLNMTRKYAKEVKQNVQFHSISAAIELFHDDFQGYPPSDPCDDYPAAMRLAEAMVGQDKLGFHPRSTFKPYDNDLYPLTLDPTVPADRDNLREREGLYLPLDGANVGTLMGLYGEGKFGVLGGGDPNGGIVLCDEYPRIRSSITGKRLGMPILYYKADVSKLTIKDKTTVDTNIYNHLDNQTLIDLELPWDLGKYHLIATSGLGTTPDLDPVDEDNFYDNIRDETIGKIGKPHKPDSYILISAGFDGVYGTRDDIYNFKD
ncbi:MAG: type II secretion system protein [Planctomycetes bacterium]|nr:type II secretion system protein [Planctomycetota bacterium]